MRVLLLGANGMLGQSIFKCFSSLGIDVVTSDKCRADYCFDFTDDDKLTQCVLATDPDVIINTAAIVDLSYCEKNAGYAYLVNARISGILAEICRKSDVYLVQISTDHYYVDGGMKKHCENEGVALVNEYARTKYLGEQLALTYENSVVLRTNIVGFRGSDKPTFIEWIIKELKVNSQMNLFTDFYTSSIHTVDFANILADVISKRPTGIYNLASSEVASKRDFIVSLSKELFNKVPIYREESVENINGPKRASCLGLDTTKIEVLLGYKMPDLHKTIESIASEYLRRECVK